MVRFGRSPAFARAPTALASPSSPMSPEIGSRAPMTQEYQFLSDVVLPLPLPEGEEAPPRV